MNQFLRLLLLCVPFAAPLVAQDGASAGHDHPHDHPHDHDERFHALEEARAARRTFAWPKEMIATFAALPLQDGGRIKPLSTYADFRLLAINGKRKLDLGAAGKLSSTEWLLDVFFFPEQAREYEVFRVDDHAALQAMGLFLQGKKVRDRYSYAELEPGIGKLFELARSYSHKQAAERSAFEKIVLDLATNVDQYRVLEGFLDFARHRFALDATEGLRLALGEAAPQGRYSTVLERAEALRVLLLGLPRRVEDAPNERVRAEVAGADALLAELSVYHDQGAQGPALVPPAVSRDERGEWSTPQELVAEALAGTRDVRAEARVVRALEELERSKGDLQAMGPVLAVLAEDTARLAGEREEYWRVPLEVRFYRADFFTNALAFFLLGFLAIAVSWMLPAARWPARIAWGGTTIGLLLLCAGITMRCILRGRPPVSTLYETILFITAVCLIVALFIEYVNKERIALAVSTLLGAGGMFLSMKYELKEAVAAGDTMPSLQAVLDTNFWLATHVTTVTMGYSAGLLAAALAHVWILGRIFGWRGGDEGRYKSLTRMVYGVSCFGLLFSVVGTVLGGIWANYSWGRFWGWDPKENGALLIVLWFLLVLHGRMGGYIRDFGLHALSILGGCVVSFSWWGVNLLNVGLHSYGFTHGMWPKLFLYWGLELLIVGAGVVWWLVARAERARQPQTAPQSSLVEVA